MPVQADTMNYVSAVYAAVILIIIVDWFARARKSYRSKDDRVETAEELVGHK
jgi:choline transport protein